MKKVLMKGLALAFVGSLAMAGSAMAFPFTEVEGFVNPDMASITSITSDISQIELTYTFNVVDALYGAEMNWLSLEFESDVFSNVINFAVTVPGDWTVSTVSSTNSLYEISSAGSTVGVGESLMISATVSIFNDALINSDLWDEGQIWGQSWFSRDTLGGGDGGSTAPVPEPATMLLFGSGLVGLAGYGRKKIAKK